MLKKTAMYAALTIALIVVLGAIDLIILTTPEQLQAQLAEELSRELNADLELDSIEHSPFSTRVYISNIRLRSRGENARVFFSAEKAELTLNYLSFLGGKALERAMFQNPVITIYSGGDDVIRFEDNDLLDSLLRGGKNTNIPMLEFRDATIRIFNEDSPEPMEFSGMDLEIDPSSGSGPNSLEFTCVYDNGEHLCIRAEADPDTGVITISTAGDGYNYIYLTDRLHYTLQNLSRDKSDFAGQLLDIWDYIGAGGGIQVGSMKITYDPSKPEPDRWGYRGTFYLQDASVKLQEFPYYLERMSGKLEIIGSDIILSDLQAFNDKGKGCARGDGRILNFLSSASDVDLTIHTKDIPFDEKLRDAMSVDANIRKMWDDIRPRGYCARATAKIRKRFDQKRSTVELEMDLDGRASASYVFQDADGGEETLEVSNIRGKVLFSQENITINVMGETAGVTVEVKDGRIIRPGMPDSEMDIVATAVDFEVTEKIRSALPPQISSELKAVDILNKIGLTVRLTKKKDDEEPSVRIEVTPRKAGLSYSEFPYRLDEVEGMMVYENDRIEFKNIRAIHDGARITASGSITNLSDEPVYDIEIHGEDVLVDTALYNAMPPDVRDTWDEYIPKSAMEDGGAGRAKIDLRIKGRGEKPEVSVDIRVVDGTVRYVEFPYTVTGVSGLLKIRPEGVYLEGIRGRHGDSVVLLDKGEILDGKVNVQVASPSIALEKDLRDALSEEIQQVYDSLQPGGTVDVVVQLTQQAGDEELKTEVTITSDGTLEFIYKEFPLPARDVVTEIFMGPDGVFVKKLACKLGKAVIPLKDSDGKPYPNTCLVSFNSSDTSVFVLNLKMIKGLIIDDELKKALPEDLRKALTRMEVLGRVELQDLELKFLLGKDRARYEYKFKAIFDDCSLGDGPLIDKLNGEMKLHITSIPGESTDTTGSSFSNLDFYIRGLHISNLTGTIERREVDNVSFKNPADPHSVDFAAHAYGPNGKSNMTGHFTFNFGESKEYEGAFKFHGVDLAAIEAELSGKDPKNKGTISGHVEFSGEGENLGNLAGGGVMDIEDANLGQLPIVFNLNQLLKGKLPEKQIVSEGHFKFDIGDGAFDFRKLEFKSQAVRFIGYGKIKFDGTMDLTIFSDTVLRGIPVLDDIMQLFKKSIYATQIKGTFDKPKVAPASLLKRITDIPEDFQKMMKGEE